MFEKYLLESHRVLFDHGSRYGLRLLNDGIDVPARKERDHASLLLNGLDAVSQRVGNSAEFASTTRSR